MHDNREIAVNLELLPSTELDNKKLKINTYDNTNNEYVQNVTYFLSISKNNENLLREYFFAQDGVLIIDVQPNDDNIIKIIGEKQYASNAYVTLGSEYSPKPGENLTSVTPLQLTGPIFNSNGIYTFDIKLRTIDDPNNWVFLTLTDFHYEINFEK